MLRTRYKMENKADMAPARDLKSNVETPQQGRRRQWKVVVRSMGLGVALSAFNSMLGKSRQEKHSTIS